MLTSKSPIELMAFMVKNPGLIPSVSTIWAGEIGRRRDAMFEMFQGYVFSEPQFFSRLLN